MVQALPEHPVGSQWCCCGIIVTVCWELLQLLLDLCAPEHVATANQSIDCGYGTDAESKSDRKMRTCEGVDHHTIALVIKQALLSAYSLCRATPTAGGQRLSITADMMAFCHPAGAPDGFKRFALKRCEPNRDTQ
jgi:hypothetical protein